MSTPEVYIVRRNDGEDLDIFDDLDTAIRAARIVAYHEGRDYSAPETEPILSASWLDDLRETYDKP